jgi:hypothetical protein
VDVLGSAGLRLGVLEGGELGQSRGREPAGGSLVGGRRCVRAGRRGGRGVEPGRGRAHARSKGGAWAGQAAAWLGAAGGPAGRARVAEQGGTSGALAWWFGAVAEVCGGLTEVAGAGGASRAGGGAVASEEGGGRRVGEQERPWGPEARRGLAMVSEEQG